LINLTCFSAFFLKPNFRCRSMLLVSWLRQVCPAYHVLVGRMLPVEMPIIPT
jgi:hypothetical protein